MSVFTGTRALIRFVLLRDRLRLSLWVLALAGLTAASVPALDDMFATEAERQGRAALMDSPTGIVFGGPGYGLDDYTLGPMLVNELTMTLLIALAVMSVLHVVRHTRAEEESGRSELLRASVLGSGAQMAAALVTVALANLAIGALIALSMTAFDLPAADSLAYGLGLALAGITFGALAAVGAQVSEHGRSAAGLAFLAVGVLFMCRVVGDISEPGGNALSWLSPFAWVQQARPFDQLSWAPLALYPAVVAVLFTVAFALAARRDLGAGLVATRPGPADAGRLLSGTFALHLHQQRGAVLAWTAAVFLFALSFGSLATEVEAMIDTNPELAAVIGDDADDLVGGFLGTMGVYVTMVGAAYGALSVLRARTEETSGRAEAVLATAVGRTRWFGSALLVAALATTLIVVVGGAGLGLAAAASLDDASWAGTMVEASLTQIPAALAFGALAALLSGAVPRAVPLVWAWLGYSILATVLGALVGLPDQAMDASAFEILAAPPMDDFEAVPFLVYAGAVLVAAAVALIGFRRRDLTTA
ncbi:ABC transporter permease [Nocardiopsis oceani]